MIIKQLRTILIINVYRVHDTYLFTFTKPDEVSLIRGQSIFDEAKTYDVDPEAAGKGMIVFTDTRRNRHIDESVRSAKWELVDGFMLNYLLKDQMTVVKESLEQEIKVIVGKMNELHDQMKGRSGKEREEKQAEYDKKEEEYTLKEDELEKVELATETFEDHPAGLGMSSNKRTYLMKHLVLSNSGIGQILRDHPPVSLRMHLLFDFFHQILKLGEKFEDSLISREKSLAGSGDAIYSGEKVNKLLHSHFGRFGDGMKRYFARINITICQINQGQKYSFEANFNYSINYFNKTQ